MINPMKPEVINIKDAPPEWEMKTEFVYIGRRARINSVKTNPFYKDYEGTSFPGYFGNPFPRLDGPPGSTLERYEDWARRQILSNETFRERVKNLQDKILVCYCKPGPCHGDILATICEELNAG